MRGLALRLGLVAALAGATPAAAEAIWSGTSRGYRVEWTEDDLTATRPGAERPVFSARAFAERRFAKLLAEMAEGSAGTGCELEHRVALVSLVGTVLSFREKHYSACKDWAHPAIHVRNWSVDLERREPVATDPRDPFSVDPGARSAAVALTDLVPAALVFRALEADALVKGATGRAKPKSLGDLLDALRDGIATLDGERSCYAVPDD